MYVLYMPIYKRLRKIIKHIFNLYNIISDNVYILFVYKKMMDKKLWKKNR